MAVVADYSGVGTHNLACLIRRIIPEGSRETWASASGLDIRIIRTVLAEERQWTSLLLADSICCALGVRVDDELTVIPSGRTNASRKMALDELETAFELGTLSSVTEADIDRRIAELDELREQTLGPPSEEQLARAALERQRKRDRRLKFLRKAS